MWEIAGDKPTLFFGFLFAKSICQRKLEAGYFYLEPNRGLE
jgi:hypothetical protein